jgi:aminoglycoside phosphotransferase (APT) family kinase protein
MNVDLHASDPKTAVGPAVEDIIAAARHQLELGSECEWDLVTWRRKLGKMLFEVEQHSDGTSERIIGKVSRSTRSRQTFEFLEKLWNAGMRPPSKHMVPRPVAYLRDLDLLLQGKAPGEQLASLIQARSDAATGGASQAAAWLARLHSLDVAADQETIKPASIERWIEELSAELPKQAARIRRACDSLSPLLSGSDATVPSHGDYHPLNIFLADDRVTVIDLDTFGHRERAADVAYFMAQTAIMGYLAHGNFHSTRQVRAAFLQAYEAESGVHVSQARMALYAAAAFIQSLHYERAILHTNNERIVQVWLQSAEQCLSKQAVDL